MIHFNSIVYLLVCFSCWQSGWLVAVFRIVCKKSDVTNKAIPDIIFAIGVVLAVFTVFCLGFQMWKTSRDRRYK